MAISSSIRKLRWPLAIISIAFAAFSSHRVYQSQYELTEVAGTVKPLDLKSTVSDKDLIASGQLGGPLYPTQKPDPEPWDILGKLKLSLNNSGLENQGGLKPEDRRQARQEFAEAMQLWNSHEYKKSYQKLQAFTEKYPQSHWADEATLHMGCEAKFNGRFNEAEEHFNKVIERNENNAYLGGQLLYDKAKSRLGILRIYQNRFDDALAEFTSLKDKSSDWRQRTYAANWLRKTSELVGHKFALLDCGRRALAGILEKKGLSEQSQAVLQSLPSKAYGDSLKDLKKLAGQYGLESTPLSLSLEDLAKLPLPAIVRIAQPKSESGHYWLLEKIEGDKLSLYDAQNASPYQQTIGEFAREWSGHALVFNDGGALPGRRLNNTDADQLMGGCCGLPRPEDRLGNPKPKRDPDNPKCSKGEPDWVVNMLNFNLFVTDTPLWYVPAIGPAVHISLSYNSQSSIAQHEPFGNKWSFNYASYIVNDPGQGLTVFMPDGERSSFLDEYLSCRKIQAVDVNGADSCGFLVDVYKPRGGGLNQIKKLGDNHFELRIPGGKVFVYQIPAGTTSMQPFLTEIRDIYGQKLTFAYDQEVRLRTITDATNKVTSLSYDSRGLVTEVRDPFSRTASFTYDANKNLVGMTDMGGYTSTLKYDQDVYLTEIKNALGAWKFYIEPATAEPNDMDRYPPPGGKMWANYRITVTDPLGHKEEFHYDGFSTKGWHIAPNDYVEYLDADVNNYTKSAKTEYYYKTSSLFSNFSRIVYKNGMQDRYTYDALGNILTFTETDEKGENPKTITYTRNQMHNLSSIEEPDGHTTTLSYASNGLDLTAVSSPVGTVRMVYDNKHNPIETTDINGVKTSISYNEFGQISSQTDELGQVTEYHYDVDHRLQRISKAGVTLKSLTYDEKDRILTETDHTGLTLRFDHNDLDTVTRVTYPDQRSIAYNYPSCPGVIESRENRSGRLYNYRYNGRKELISTLAPDQTVQKFSYDKNSQITEFTDENQNPTRYEYDSVGRLTKEIQTDGRNRQFIYGANGLIAREISVRGIETSYSYDSNDRLIRVQYSDDTPAETFSYDSLGRVVSISDGSGLYQLAYNRDSSLQSVDGPWAGDTISYFYDAKGRLVRSRYEGGQDVFYTYDDLDRLSRILHGGRSFEYSYSAQNLLEKISLANGLSSHYQWDMLQRISKLTNRGSNASLLTQHEFSYNEQDFISQEKNLNTLAPEKTPGLKNFTYNQLNQMLSDSSQPSPFEYDADGNLTKGFTLSGRLFTASYDALNRMKEVATTDEQGVVHRKEYHYRSSGLVSRELYYQNGQLKDDIRTIHDGFLPVQDRNAQNQVLREYTWGIGKGGGVEGLLSLRQAGMDYYYLYDAKGNVTGVYDQGQKAVAQYAYDAFGELLAESGSLVQPFRFSTKRYDELFGLYDYGYRRYSPLMHRWLTRDPIGLEGGTNLYGFVGNNPINMIDPEGHCAIAGAIGGAAWDVGSQLFENNGKFSCINWGSVASSAAIGGLTCGVVGKLAQLSGKGLGKLSQLMGKGTKSGTEVVTRWMSRAELEATRSTGLVRGGRSGTHFVSDTSNSNVLRARQRLALPHTPEIKVRLEVPRGAFSAPSRVQPAFNMPGGGMERTGTGRIPARVLE